MSDELKWDHVFIVDHVLTMENNKRDCWQCDGNHPSYAIAVKDKKIHWFGFMNALPENWQQKTEKYSVFRNQWLTPGFIDCHTHLIYGGSRFDEFTLRQQGLSYIEIAKQGGGIQKTLQATRQLSFDKLFLLSKKRLKHWFNEGVTTVEIKSGYALDLANERKILQIAQQLQLTSPINVRKTFLGAHTIPPEFKNQPDDYVEYLCQRMLPHLHHENLIDAVDVFCESIAFSYAQTEKIFQAAQTLEIPIKIHAEQLSDQKGAQLAARFKALSADHLEYANAKSIEAMASAGVAAVLLPGAFYFLQEKKLPPIELLRQFQVPMAIATDHNPGTSPLSSLRTAMNMACVLWNFTAKEAIFGATQHAATALGMQNTHGSITLGKEADFAIWQIEQPEQLCYAIGEKICQQRVLAGQLCE